MAPARRSRSRARASRAAATICAGGRAARRRTAPPPRSPRAPRPARGRRANASGRPDVLAVVQPAGGLLARPDAAVPLAARRSSRPRQRGRRPRTRSRRPSSRRRGRRSPNRSPCTLRQVQSGVSSSRTGRSAADQPVDDTHGTAGRGPSRARARARCRRSATASAGRRRSRSKETSSSWPRGLIAPSGPLVGRELEARVADDQHRLERDQPEHPVRRPARPPERAGRGSGACAARRPCPSRSRRGRRRRATRARPPRRGSRTPAGRRRCSAVAASSISSPSVGTVRVRGCAGSGRRRCPSSRSGAWRRGPAPLSPWKYSLKRMLSFQAGSVWSRSTQPKHGRRPSGPTRKSEISRSAQVGGDLVERQPLAGAGRVLDA